MSQSAHVDTFTRDHLPPVAQQPEFIFELPSLQFPAQLNCATELLDRHIAAGHGGRLCIRAPGGMAWTYADLQEQANRIANVLVNDMGLVPGNRVLLRAANKPMLVACWFAAMKTGGVAVATMPLLRARELGQIIDKAKVSHALCDVSLCAELDSARAQHPALKQCVYFGDGSPEGLEARLTKQPAHFDKREHRC